MEVPPSFLKTWVKVVKALDKLPRDERLNSRLKIERKYKVDYTETHKCFVGEAYGFKKDLNWTKCAGCFGLGFGVIGKMLDLDSFMEHRAKIYLHFKDKHPQYLVKKK